MGYIEEIKNSKRKLNIMYGMIGENDLSDEEKALKLEVEGWLKDENMTASELVNKLDKDTKDISAITDNSARLMEYFDTLVKNQDNNALATLTGLKNAKTAYDMCKGRVDNAKKNEASALKTRNTAKHACDKAKADYKQQETYKQQAYEKAIAAAKSKFDAVENKLAESEELKKKYRACKDEAIILDQAIPVYEDARKGFPENSQEYADYDNKIADAVARYKQLLKDADSYKKSYETLDKETAGVNHKADYDNEMKAIEAKDVENENRLKAYDEIVKQKEAELKSAETIYKFATENAKNLETEIKKYKRELDDRTKICCNCARTKLNLKKEIIIQKMGNVTDYEDIDAALKNTKPRVTDETIAKGLAEVKKAYQCFKQKHWGITRMFRKMGLGETGREYTAFSSLRTKFIRYTGMRQADVDKYLDDGVLQGTLKTHCEKYDIHPETIMTKNYAKCAGVSTDVYAAHVTDCYKNVLFNPAVKSSPAVMLVKVEEGLKMLSALGAQNRKSHSQALTSAINEIKEDLTAKGMEYGFEATIETEVSNALKKPADRVPVNRSLNSSYTAYTNVVKAMEKENDKDDNAVLIRRDAKHYPEAYANSEVTVHMEAPKADPKQVAVELDENAEVNEDMQAGKGLEKNLVFQKA